LPAGVTTVLTALAPAAGGAVLTKPAKLPPAAGTLPLGIETPVAGMATVPGVATAGPAVGGAVPANETKLPPDAATLLFGIETPVPNTATLPDDGAVEPVAG